MILYEVWIRANFIAVPFAKACRKATWNDQTINQKICVNTHTSGGLESNPAWLAHEFSIIRWPAAVRSPIIWYGSEGVHAGELFKKETLWWSILSYFTIEFFTLQACRLFRNRNIKWEMSSAAVLVGRTMPTPECICMYFLYWTVCLNTGDSLPTQVYHRRHFPLFWAGVR